jgi:hypothetical protein
MITLCNGTITLSAILFVLPAEKSFHDSIAFSSFIQFISSSLQNARHVAYIKKEPFMSEHLGNHTKKNTKAVEANVNTGICLR